MQIESSPERRREIWLRSTPRCEEIYSLRTLLRQDDLNMWVTAFADVAEVILGVSVEKFHAFDDEGRKRIAWGYEE